MPGQNVHHVVVFEPEGNRVEVPEGTYLSRIIDEIGIEVPYPCGGQGTCGKCRVHVTKNPPEPSPAEKRVLTLSDIENGVRLACQTKVQAPMTVVVPEESRIGGESQILGGAGDDWASGDPPILKQYVELPEPSLEDDRPDFQRLTDAVGDCAAGLPLMQALPARLREAGFKGTAVLSEKRLVDFEPGDTAADCHGVAFDLGTTTLVGVLLDLRTGKELATTSRMNPQTQYGDDVVSRIQRVREQDTGLADLHGCIVGAVNDMIGTLCEDAGVARGHVYEATFSGNTTMQHLLAGISPSALGEIPFVPAVRRSLVFPAAGAGIAIHPEGTAIVFPVVGGFVGGDTVAGMLVTQLAEAQAPTLLVDIGTNGELALNVNGELLSASTAAGPAFEGANIRHGMRATRGAIQEVVLGDGVRYSVIGDARPAGLCGSALIDATGELLRHGLLSPQGQLLTGGDLPAELPESLRARVIEGDDGPEFIIAPAGETSTGRPVTVTHRDFRSIQLGTGAIRAGITVLLSQAGIEPASLDRVLVAGAFGNYIRPHNAQRMGLLPFQVPMDRITFAGNTSLAGARRVALSRAARLEAERIGGLTRHVELSRDPNFQMAYMEGMFFPSEDPVA